MQTEIYQKKVDKVINLIYIARMKDQRETLGKNLRALRLARKRSQKWLANAIGMDGAVSSSYICRIEKGQTMPLGDTLGKIAKALGVTIDQLCTK